MPDELLQISARIRELREILEIEPERIAKDLGLPVETYLSYEAAEKDIPISALYTIANTLGVDFTVLLTGEAPRMATHTLVRAGEGVKVERYPGYDFESLAFNFKNRIMEPMLVQVTPEGQDPKLVSHRGQEFNYCLSGSIRVVVGPRELILHAGDSLYFDPSLPHGQWAVEGPAQFLTVIYEP